MAAGIGGDTAPANKMDEIYRYQRLIYDVTRRYYLAGRLRMLAGLKPPPGGTVLEIGCGTAWNLIRTAGLYPKARLYGFDLSNQMLVTARGSIAKAGLQDRITVAQGDATNFNGAELFNVEKFDRIFVSYALSMIPGWPRVLDEAARNLAPGGSIHVVDFGQCEGLPKSFKALLYAWLAKFHVHPSPDLAREINAAAARHGLQAEVTSLYRGYSTLGILRSV